MYQQPQQSYQPTNGYMPPPSGGYSTQPTYGMPVPPANSNAPPSTFNRNNLVSSQSYNQPYAAPMTQTNSASPPTQGYQAPYPGGYQASPPPSFPSTLPTATNSMGPGTPPQKSPSIMENWARFQAPRDGRPYLFDTLSGRSYWESERGLQSEFPWSFHFDENNHKYRFNATNEESEWVYN